VSSYPNDPSHANTYSGHWEALDNLMVQVRNIMTVLDDATQHITFTDGTMLSFVAQLNTIKDDIPCCMPARHKNKARLMAKYLHEACKCFNLAAVAYRRSNKQNETFYKKLYAGLDCLVEIIDFWERLRANEDS
jgi:hypothetical protein